MEILHFDAARPYSAPHHENVTSLRLQGLDASSCDFCSVGLSYYLPGGMAAMSAGATDKIYVVIDGELTVEIGDGGRHLLRRFDSALIPAGEERSARNETNAVVTLLVVMAAG